MPIKFADIYAKADKMISDHHEIPLVLFGYPDELSLQAVKQAAARRWVRPVFAFMENKNTVQDLLAREALNLEDYEVMSNKDKVDLLREALLYAVQSSGILMRGSFQSGEFFKILMNKTNFISPGDIASHIGLFESDRFNRLILVTDGGINIKPTLETKPAIVRNAVETARKFGIEQPKVALLAAVESVYIQMQDALDDAVISKMADRGVIGDAFVDGPLSLDVALIPAVAKEKKVKGPVPGNADILVVSRIEVGSGLYKALFIFGKCQSAGIIVGGKVPVVMTSRSQDVLSRFNSIAAALAIN